MLPPARSNERREELEVVVARAWDLRPEVDLPEPQAIALVRAREVDHDVDPAGERLVHVRAHVGRQDRDAVEQLHPLQQVRDLDVRIAVACVRDLRALAEQRVCLVEQKHGIHALGIGEDAIEVLLGLPDVLVHDARRSITYRSSPRSAATTSADIVFPVPESPANSP